VAEREGFLVVVPNGTRSAPGSPQRQWNAGGGANGWQCVGAQACSAKIDDTSYVRAVLDHLGSWSRLDRSAMFATGLSNGGALAHRLGCELAEVIAAIAPVGAGNQFQTTAECAPSHPVAVLQIHGTADPCWTYETTATTCLGVSGVGLKIGALESAEAWGRRNGCSSVGGAIAEPDSDGDGLSTSSITWLGCRRPIQLLRLEGGGHTYPNGKQYMPASDIGPTLRDWGAERIWAFFDANRRPR